MSFSLCLLVILIQILPDWEGRFAEDCGISQLYRARKSRCKKLMFFVNKSYLMSIYFHFSFCEEKCEQSTEPTVGAPNGRLF